MTGKSSEKAKEKIIHLDSYEYFRCCINDETVSSVIMIPDSVIRRCGLGNPDAITDCDGNTSRKTFAFLVGTTEGRMRVFVSLSPPEKIK